MSDATGIMIGYARVSTEDQDMALQFDALMRAGVSRARIYTDKASGASDDRPGFLATFKALRSGDTLVVWKLDRLGRKLSRLIQTMDSLKAKGVQLKVLTEHIDTTTPAGILMFHMIGAFAEFERNMIVERTKAGLLAARERGRIGGRRPTIKPEQLDEAVRLMAPSDEGGEDLSVAKAAERVGISRAYLYAHLREIGGEGAEDLHD